VAEGPAPELVRTTLVDGVAERLRRSILTGNIAPGQRILVRDMENRFGVSQIPIREALRRLESEGLVQSSPQRGSVATVISLDELDQLYDFRRLLETSVAERALPHYDEDRLQVIKDALTHLDKQARAPQSDAYVEAHRNFHWAILQPGASPMIERTLRQLWQTSERYVRLAITAFHTDKRGQQQHRRLYLACRDQDGRQLREAVLSHLSLTEDAIRAWYERTQPSPHKDGKTAGTASSSKGEARPTRRHR
jgi:DNA-binding GntR family transcriptional regulator